MTGVSAVYFEGGGSSSHTITDLSLEGAQILTPISWGPGTLIRMSVRYEKGREVELVVDLGAGWSEAPPKPFASSSSAWIRRSGSGSPDSLRRSCMISIRARCRPAASSTGRAPGEFSGRLDW